MAQTAKFIDITKTFVPVDPNSFPETLSVPGQNDASPEERVPAMAYRGWNFMPTPYGYKSYFGVNQTLGVDAIIGKVDDLFVYQNALLENVLIALTNTGIWIKKGEAVGAWTQAVAYAAPLLDAHFFWTSVIIADKLYVYQQGRASYYMIDSHLTAGVTLTAKNPNFLAMQYQVGIFRAAGRLAFWDVTDSIGWANLDNFEDFEPSLETLAGNATFSDVQGKIINVVSHGEGFIIYSTKSIVYIAQDEKNLYQFKPSVIFPSTGIRYPRQVAAASPDTTHFAYTTEGLKRIVLSKPETLVPEITDFLKDSEPPVYLKVLEGRFLFLEMMDVSYIVGAVQHGENSIPPATYAFDGSDYTLDDIIIPAVPEEICPVLDGIDNGDFTDVIPGGAASPTPAPGGAGSGTKPAHPTTPNWQPEWICYIANNGVKNPDDIDWGPTPCPTTKPDGTEANMCPTNAMKIGQMTTDSSNKRAVAGKDAYTGGWTMERFASVQGAIWAAEKEAIAATIAKILARSASGTKVTKVNQCTPSTQPAPVNSCFIGRYPSEFSEPKFGFNRCSFWLTRYATKAMDISRKMTNVTTCPASGEGDVVGSFAVLAPTTQSIPGAAAGTVQPIDGPAPAIAEAALAARVTAYPDEDQIFSFTGSGVTGGNGVPSQSMAVTITAAGTSISKTTGLPVHATPVGVAQVTANVSCPPGYWCYMSGETPMCSPQLVFNNTWTMEAHNEGVEVPIAPVPESGYCVISGWTYTASDGTAASIPAGACTGAAAGTAKPPSTSTSPSGTSSANHAPKDAATDIPITDAANGLVCGQGTDGFTLDGEIITWPGTSVIIPASSFLFSLGSYAPLYPTINGAFVYDLHLKKWGKMMLPYKLLLDYSPINSSASGIVPSSVFGILGGVLSTDNRIKLFDTSPASSYITYGKIGYYRLGNTSIEEVRVDFRVPSTGVLSVDTSLDGSKLVPDLHVEQGFLGATSVRLYGAYPGKWVNIKISGVFDISYLEYRGFIQGRR